MVDVHLCSSVKPFGNHPNKWNKKKIIHYFRSELSILNIFSNSYYTI